MGLNMAAVAVISVVINGQPIVLPTPAITHQGRALVPAREVFERMGATVKWESEQKRARISLGGRWIAIAPEATKAFTNGGPVSVPEPARYVGSLLFVPVNPTAPALGARLKWEPKEKTVYINFEDERPPERMTIGDILKDADDLLGRPVLVQGEYLGWTGGGLSPATSHGAPETRSDVVLRDATGEVYCSARGEVQSDIPLGPLQSRGRRIEVEAVVAMAERDFPYLQPRVIRALTGLPGVTRTIRTDRIQYTPGETVRFTLRLANPFAEPLTLPFRSGQRFDFVVKDEDDADVWRWSHDKAFIMVLGSETLEPGDERVYEAEWDQKPSPGMAEVQAPGRYTVVGTITTGAEGLSSYPQPFLVLKAEE